MSRRRTARAATVSAATFWQRNRVVLRAWLTFILAYAGMMALLFFAFGKMGNRYLTVWTAEATAWVLRLLGANGQAQGTHVSSTLYAVDIIFECTAVFPVIIFLAAVLAYPCPWRKKLLGAAVGVPVLILVNMVRLVSLFYVGHWFPAMFESAHLLVWQALMIFFTIVLWLLWTSRVTARP